MGKFKRIAHDLYVMDKLRILWFKFGIPIDWSLMMHYIHNLHENDKSTPWHEHYE